MSNTLVNDIDPIETQDWLSAVDSLIRAEGTERAHYIINQVIDQARNGGVNIAKGGVTTPMLIPSHFLNSQHTQVIKLLSVVFVVLYVGMRSWRYYVVRKKILN